ncbi:hypothetical protein, variant [Aphanomyces invadans]|uniref:Uncharacterized bromodomain-containing protein 10 helical domain-containing protein n=1 Tax=Aphanomyces invadans TaxID=157072 RepID=A0A024TJF4_9STRA|nr:hypothetical protein, variant [Aphanomyces invadans]ETV94188.1 hypothetical protein, variant [Aphanomyces invadans]|eukprot:XP_008876949.1 hypothetical protein, variant [Aphanomyces invadans]
MSDPNPSLMLWEKRKRVKPTLFQVESAAKKVKVAPLRQPPRKGARQTPSRSKKPRSAQPAYDEDDEPTSPAKDVATARSKKSLKSASLKDVNVPSVPESVLKLIGTPFYDEDGAEWHGTTIDFNDLAELRGMWQLPAACHILWLLQQPLKLKVYNSLREYEAALLNPTTSAVLEDVFTKLLLGKKERERLNCGLGLAYDWWSKRLQEFYSERYRKWNALKDKAKARQPTASADDVDDDNDSLDTIGLNDDDAVLLTTITTSLKPLGSQNPLQTSEYKDLSPSLRCKVLLSLCETVVQQPGNLEYIREMQDDDLRVTPIGVDRCGNQYFFYPQFYLERRVYRLSDDPKADEGKVWQLWAKGLESVQSMREAFGSIAAKKGKKWPGESSLIDHLDAMLELMRQDRIEEQKNEDRALKRAILEAMPRKRSARIQVKALEKFEDESQRKAQAQAEEEARAEQKRVELLASMEREREQQAKKLAALREQRVALKIDRETRRQKRMEQEESQFEKERLDRESQEQLAQQQQAQRELRALQRQQGSSSLPGDSPIDITVANQQDDTAYVKTPPDQNQSSAD